MDQNSNSVNMNILYESDLKFTGENTSGHTIPVEPCACLGGSGNSPDPMDYLLVSLGSCTGIKVLRGLEERGVTADSLKISIAGKRREQPPTVLENLHVTFYLHGKFDPKVASEVTRDVMTHTCPVAVMMGKATTLTWECRNTM